MWRKPILLAMAVLLPVSVLAEGAQASVDRWKRSHAAAMLWTYPSTDQVWTWLEQDMARHSLDIRPFQAYGECPYCVEDWHLLAYADWRGEFESAVPPISFTQQDAWAELAGMEAQFVLDGVPIDVVRTPIKSVHSEFALSTFEPALEDFFGFDVTVGRLWGLQWGRIMSPGELLVGPHTLQVSLTFRDGTQFSFDPMTFEISGPDSTACTAA